MAAFIAKQMVGDQLKSVKGALGGDEKEGEEGAAEEVEEDPEIVEARREAEEKRKEKYRKMEEERENMRQSIRDKYGLKKKEEPVIPVDDPDMAGRLGRTKKTPEEMAAEKNADSDDELSNSFLPKDLNDFTNKMQQIPGKVTASVTEATEKCVVQ